ncbi:YjbH domain-containing protein [Cereibacter changlensis]|uniref:YjbH domain-containing protein n=1 Tax=Cereibacter changlensis TaxID=402884 RepID=A0A4U0YRP1_9RHOB|nr:YjbH domain-containing protein [Cereibacter changlensis]TKA95212.1 YjbH domain-containing protein [Cereibacter changlensis]
MTNPHSPWPGLLAGVALLAAVPGAAQTRPTLNFYGASGLIDMPSAEAQRDGVLTASTSFFGGIGRTTLGFQITPRLSASFRYAGIRDWNATLPEAERTGVNAFDTYYDRSFDLRYQILTEGRYRPALAIGLQDFIGTGVLSGEYIVATKHLTPELALTAGLGWGRLGSEGDIGRFGDRPAFIPDSTGGEINADQWFRGRYAPFAGIEWQPSQRWALKAEYSSDAYEVESGARRVFEHRSPFNFGVEYRPNPGVQLGAYSLHGSEFGLAVHFLIDPRDRASVGLVDDAPVPIRPRPPRAANPGAWSPDWIGQPDANRLLRGNMQKVLTDSGIHIEALALTGDAAELRIRNTRHDAEAQAIGRTARAMAWALPASVERFEIVPVVNGVPTARVVLRRADLERLEFAPDAATALRPQVAITEVGPPLAPLQSDLGLYPGFSWSLSPYLRTSLFDPEEPLRADLGLRLRGQYRIAPGLLLSGSVTQKLAGNIDEAQASSNSVLPHVRSDTGRYSAEGETALERLTATWYARPADALYSRVTLGYLERMYGGASAELLWRPVNSRLALGAEVNYARKRGFDQRFGFLGGDAAYDIVTGHVSAYYDFGDEFTAQLDVGRYLAGDVGATLSLSRQFANGWKIGAFATKTDVSAEDFGEGSFDKGIRLEIPLTVILGQPTRQTSAYTLRPLTRDGGARLAVEGRLYDMLQDHQGHGLDRQWGRFWK